MVTPVYLKDYLLSILQLLQFYIYILTKVNVAKKHISFIEKNK